MPVLADATGITRAFLLSDAQVIASGAGNRWYTNRLPANAPRDAFVGLITAIDESSVTDAPVDRTNDATVQIEGWGRYLDDHRYVRNIIALAHARLRAALPGWPHAAGIVSAVLADSGIRPFPDDELGRARAGCTVRIICYPRSTPVA